MQKIKGKSFAGIVFENCDFSAVIFKNCDFSGAYRHEKLQNGIKMIIPLNNEEEKEENQ